MTRTGVTEHVTNKSKALDLVKIGMWVFPCREKTVTVMTPEGERTFKAKSPYLKDGLLDASNDPERVSDWWAEHPGALVGVVTGPSGIVVLDIDVKRDEEGNVVVDGFDSLDRQWLPVPSTFSYTTVGGEGKHMVYTDPGTVRLTGNGKYRGMEGVDRRGGNSYAIWVGDVPTSRSGFTEAPEWLLDEAVVRSADKFEGGVKAWYEALTPGDPNVLVRRAIDRINNDMSHSEMVAAQFEAVRLGAEGNPGVPQLLEALEDAWLARPAENHTTAENEWEYKFAEALASGIEKHGGAISLVRDMPAYSLSIVPATVPDRLVTGPPGDRVTFNQLLNEMIRAEQDDLKVLSVMWNAPTVSGLAREWGLEFTMKRVREARKTPEPERENPSLEEKKKLDPGRIITDEEVAYVRDHPTFIDEYLEASLSKGFNNPDYDVPAAWTLLSMAFGGRAFIPKGVNLGMNIWFNVLGYSGTGKTTSNDFLTDCLDLLLKETGEVYYNLGAESSPEGLHETLLLRDGKPSMIHHDEASDFFQAIKSKDWMASVKDKMSDWYMGRVRPSQKIRLKDLRGKSARTSFNVHMLATPDRLLGLVDTAMFETGFLARYNWYWGAEPENDDIKYLVSRSSVDEEGISPAAYELVADLLFATRWMPSKPVPMDWTDEAEDRLTLAHRDMDMLAKERDYYTATEPAVTRLGRDTLWKCASLLALYRGETVIQYVDAITAVYYVEKWFNTLFRVVGAAGEGDFNRDANEIEAFIRANPGGVSLARIYQRFRGMIQRDPREVEARINFLVTAGRILTKREGDRVIYRINGTVKNDG